MPLSIPFRQLTSINVTIHRDAADPPGPVQIDVLHCSADNGEASIQGVAELEETGVIQMRGDAQTHPGHSGQIQMRAQFQGLVTLSAGFSVCAHPCAVQNGPDFAPHVYMEIRQSPFGENDEPAPPSKFMAGLYVELVVKSDSGIDADLDEVLDQEFVSAPLDHSASMHGDPHNPPDQGAEESAISAILDRHDIGVEQVLDYAAALAGQMGHWSNDQLDRFRCRRCDPDPGQWHVTPMSGYRVTRTIFQGKHNRIRLRVRKEARPCTVAGVTTAAGPSPAIEVVLDLERRTLDAEEVANEWAALAGIGG
jgi:hypothetical protein